MELDDMKQAWQALDHRLEQQHALSLQLFRDGRLDLLRRGLRPLVWGQAVQMLIGAGLSLLAAAFWATHLNVPHLLVEGLLVHAYGLLLVVFAGRTLYLIHHVDHAAPIVLIQRQLAALRAWRVGIEAPCHAVLGCFIWIPVTLMNLAWFGIDLWSPRIMYWGIASGLAGLALVAIVVRLMRRTGRAHQMENNAAGRSLENAEAVLAEIARFERP